MKSILYHFSGIQKTIDALSKGKFLVFFLPGIIITIIYYYVLYRTRSYQDMIALDTGYSWLDTVTGWIETGVSYVFGFMELIFEQIYIYIIITLLSPFNTALAEQFDTSLTGTKFPGGFIRFVNDFFRMIWVVMIVITLQLGFMLLYWMISWFIPDIIDEIMYFLIASFFFGFSFYDFHLERYRKGVLASLGYAFENIWTMILSGGLFLLIYSIPVVGIPLAPVLIIMISTVVYLKKEGIQANTEVIQTETE